MLGSGGEDGGGERTWGGLARAEPLPQSAISAWGGGRLGAGEPSVLGAGLPPQGLCQRAGRAAYRLWAAWGLALLGSWAGVVRVAGTHCGVGGWEHSRGAFQSLLSNAWLWYSSRAPLKHTRPGSTLRLSLRPPPRGLPTSKIQERGFQARVPGSPASSMKPPRELSGQGGPPKTSGCCFSQMVEETQAPSLLKSLTPKASAAQAKNTRGCLPLPSPLHWGLGLFLVISDPQASPRSVGPLASPAELSFPGSSVSVLPPPW